MKSAAVAIVLLALGAAPPVEHVPVGAFRTWGVRPTVPLGFSSGGLAITVTARPCPVPPDTEGCRDDGSNNQATITVAALGLAPFAMLSDPQASFVRVAAVRLDRLSPRIGVAVDNQHGGSAGLTTATVIAPVPGGFRAVRLQRADGGWVEGRLADRPRDVSGDGIVDFVLEDASFDGTFGCNACSPRPPVVLSVVGGRSVDLSARASVRPVFAADIAPVRAMCRSTHADRNGNCAAYLADAARLGRFAAAWRDMLAHYERGSRFGLWQRCTAPRGLRDTCPPGSLYRSFPESVRAFLVRTGYITPAQAAAAPLS